MRTTNFRKTIGEVLAMARENHSLGTQEETAAHIGVSRSSISKWESGGISFDGLVSYAKALDMKVSEVVAIAENAPVSSFSSFTRSISQLYWNKRKNSRY